MASSTASHDTRSALERKVCEAMRWQGVAHEHRSLRFRVQKPSGEAEEYRPDIVARRGPILFLLEPIEGEAGADRMALLSRLLEQHSPEIILVIVADGVRLDALPADAYDEAYAASDVVAAVRRIRLQDPKGLVRPFPKPRSDAGL